MTKMTLTKQDFSITKTLLITVSLIFISACANKNCRELRNEQEKSTASAAGNANSTSDTTAISVSTDTPAQESGGMMAKVKIFKYDGSKQCGMAEATPLEKMQKELKGIKVFSAQNLPDGLMHIQACGTPTGKANVYEIDKKDLSAAKKLGFKEWIY